MPRRRAQIPDENYGRPISSRASARDEVVIGTEKVAGGRGDVRSDRRGPRLRPGSMANPRATARDVAGRPTAASAGEFEYDAELLGQKPVRGAMAPQTVVPTNTTGTAKTRRTWSAGYDRQTQTLSVIFRDGTSWNYYGVTYQMWTAFKASPSPGRYIRTRLDFKAYGPPGGAQALPPSDSDLLAAAGDREDVE